MLSLSLLGHGAIIFRYFSEVDICRSDRCLMTAFHLAARNRSPTSLRMLCEAVEDVPMRQDIFGNTPLHYAVKYGK
jgi:ankyrin repeat protein